MIKLPSDKKKLLSEALQLIEACRTLLASGRLTAAS